MCALLKADLKRKVFLEKKYEGPIGVRQFLSAIADWRFLSIVFCRISIALEKRHLSFVGKLFFLLNLICFGIEVSRKCKIEGGLYFPHTIGTVIGAEKIGHNVTIYHGVTIGGKFMDTEYKSRPNYR
jgi:serine O-acetyltransferase